MYPSTFLDVCIFWTHYNLLRSKKDRYIQGVWDIFNILIFCYFFSLVGGIDIHYSSFESLDPPSFIYVMTVRMDDWNPPESWKGITCMMMIHAGHLNKEIMVAAQCSLIAVRTI